MRLRSWYQWYRWVKKALELLTDSMAAYKYIIFMTDGDDTTSSYTYESIISEAQSMGVTIYTIGLGSANESNLTTVATGTGGKYYYASVDDSSEEVESLDGVFDLISDETIDRQLDSNSDGISDYYTKLIAEGKLTTGTGLALFPFASYEDIQANADYDGDGLLNGEEIVISEFDGMVYVTVYANPTDQDSDNDLYTDYEEANSYLTNPLKRNLLFLAEDVDYLSQDTNYISDRYKKSYDEHVTRRVGVWVGLNVFGHDWGMKTYLYKTAILDMFDALQEENLVISEIKDEAAMAMDLVDDLSFYVKYAGSAAQKISEIDLEKLNQLNHTLQEVNDVIIETARDASNPELADSVKEAMRLACFEAVDEYTRVSGEVSGLTLKTKLTSKLASIGEIADKIGTTVSICSEMVDFIFVAASFSSNVELIRENVYLLNQTIANTEDNQLKNACLELKLQMNGGLNGYLITGADILANILTTTTDILLSEAIASTGVGAIIIASRELLDFTFHFSDVAEACTYLYGVTTLTNINATAFYQGIRQTYYNGYYTAYGNNIHEQSQRYFNLAILRIVSEMKMKEVNEANSFLLEWAYDLAYSPAEVDENITKLNSIKYNYLFY